MAERFQESESDPASLHATGPDARWHEGVGHPPRVGGGQALPEFKKTPLFVRAKGQMGVNAAYAALFEPEIGKLKLEGLPASQAEGPDYLNVLKVWDLPQLWDVLGERAEVKNP